MKLVAVSFRPITRVALLLTLLAATQVQADGLVYRRNSVTNSRRTSYYRPQPLYRRYTTPRVHYPPRVYNYRPYRPPAYRPPAYRPPAYRPSNGSFYGRPGYGGNRAPNNRRPASRPTNFRWGF